MVWVLILAAAAGAVVFLVLRLWVVLHSRGATPRESLSLVVVAGSGGHTTEILRLLESLSSAYSPRHYILADTDEMSAKKINSFELDRANRDSSTMRTKYYLHRIPRSREVQQSWLSTVISTLHSMWVSFPLIYRVKPDLAELERREREKSSFQWFTPPNGRHSQRCANPKAGARCSLLDSHAGAGPKDLGHPPLHSRATAESWTGRGATGREPGAPTGTRTWCAGAAGRGLA
ncbi:UDP-N-acetylglucosamine transferase subunit ALG14 homolog isoform X1 [Lepus europaeus]|uniref:UDP-N-acetylglucosamine transferase subunit ALG14 homolog isoform X1 n=1 Tax=Lepus europaeus TaxID=9983 RepID=UPI002B47624A|nr:UDP-N-acetylglucosamine transferase subunit ALG14 homolog isoform X1 [Lepus europaeus]